MFYFKKQIELSGCMTNYIERQTRRIHNIFGKIHNIDAICHTSV